MGQVIEILHKLNNGEKGVNLAKEFKVTEATISNIKHNKLYQNGMFTNI
jgi:hypothetical protein